MQENNKTHLFNMLLLAAIVIIAFWQVAFLQYSLKWDMLDCYLPWRYHPSECMKNGIFPFWNPYQMCGYPTYADMRSSFYPLSWIIGSTFGYSNYSFHFLFIFYSIVGGIGLYRLNYHFNQNAKAALIVAVAYSLSGIIVSRSQELSTLAGIAWIPYVLLYYLKLMQQYRIRYVLLSSVFMSLMVNGGYQAITVMLVYLLLTIFLYYAIGCIRKGDYTTLFKQVKLNAVFAGLLVLMLIPNIISLIQAAPYVGRFGGLDETSISVFPFSPQSCISFLLPFASVKNTSFFNTDLSMTNIYFGIIILIFSIYAMFRKRTGLEYVLLGFACVALLTSFGGYTPVRGILYKILPGMNMFRGSAYFIVFAAIPLLIVAGNSLSEVINDIKVLPNLILKIIVAIALLIIAFVIFSIPNIDFSDLGFFKAESGFFGALENSTIYEHIFLQGIIQLIVLSIFAFLLFKKKRIVSIGNAILLVVIIEMLISVQLNIYYTSVSEASPIKIHDELMKLPKGFPIPDNYNIEENSDKSTAVWPLWRNTCTLAKKVSFDGFNSFYLWNYSVLTDSLPNLKNAVLKNNIVYLSDKIYPYSELERDSLEGIDPKNLYTDPETFEKYMGFSFVNFPNDLIEIVDFTPNKFIISTETAHEQLITLLQAEFTGWHVFIDEQETDYFVSNKLFLSAVLPQGKHTVRFEYTNNSIIVSFVFSMSIFIIVIGIILFGSIKSGKVNKKHILIIIVVLAGLSGMFFMNIISSSNQNLGKIDEILETTNKWKEEFGEDLSIIYNVGRPNILNNELKKRNYTFDFEHIAINSNNGIQRLIYKIEDCKNTHIVYAWSKTVNPPEALEIIREKYQEVSEYKDFEEAGIMLFSVSGSFERESIYSSYHDMETEHEGWSQSGTLLDSLTAWKGRKSFKMDSTILYSTTLEIDYSEMKKLCNSYAYVSIMVKGQDKDGTFLVFSHENNAGAKDWVGLNISDFTISEQIASRSNWQKVVLYHEMKEVITEGDKIKIFIWNPGKKVLFLDDFFVRFYEKRKEF